LYSVGIFQNIHLDNIHLLAFAPPLILCLNITDGGRGGGWCREEANRREIKYSTYSFYLYLMGGWRDASHLSLSHTHTHTHTHELEDKAALFFIRGAWSPGQLSP